MSVRDTVAPAIDDQHMKLVSDLREKFNSDYANANPDKYDPRDVSRAQESDTWMMHFLHHQKDDVVNAAKMMDTVLKWRRESSINDIGEDDIPLDLRQLGAVFFHNQNKTEKDIMVFKIKLNKKEARFNKYGRMTIMYLLDQYQRRNPMKTVVALLDMSEAGVSNVDIDLTKFLVTCFTTYFPGMLEYILVYDMPWIINAIWTIIKQILSEEEQKYVIFCKKSTIHEYIDKASLPIHMGGTDTYAFSYTRFFEANDNEGVEFMETEANGVTENSSFDENSLQYSVGRQDSTELTTPFEEDLKPDNIPNGDAVPMSSDCQTSSNVAGSGQSKKTSKKQVNWAVADQVNEFTSCSSNDLSLSPTSQAITTSDKTGSYRITVVIAPSQRIADRQNYQFNRISLPTSELQFTRPGINNEAPCSIKLSNNTPLPLAYKVKTTDPKNYRVKQGRGILAPSHSETINIVLLAGKEIKRDKFLVLSTSLKSGEMSQSDLSAFWKTVDSTKIHEHKLRCHEAALELKSPSLQSDAANGLADESLPPYSSLMLNKSISSTASLSSTNDELRQELNQIKLMLKVIVSLLVLLIAAVIYK